MILSVTIYEPALRRETNGYQVTCDEIACGRAVAVRGSVSRATAEALARGALVYEVEGQTRHRCATCRIERECDVAQDGAA